MTTEDRLKFLGCSLNVTEFEAKLRELLSIVCGTNKNRVERLQQNPELNLLFCRSAVQVLGILDTTVSYVMINETLSNMRKGNRAGNSRRVKKYVAVLDEASERSLENRMMNQ